MRGQYNQSVSFLKFPHPNPRLWHPASPYLLHPWSRLPGGEGAFTEPYLREKGLKLIPLTPRPEIDAA